MRKLLMRLLPFALAMPVWPATPSHLPFINDNYSEALLQAKQRKLPIFVEVWAPW